MQTTTDQIAVLGYGVTGQSVAQFLVAQGKSAVVLDTRARNQVTGPMLDGVVYHWEVTQWPLIEVESAVVSPGLSLNSCLVRNAQAAGVQLISDIDLFFSVADKPVISITGTNGKSTVTSLVGHLLQSAGLRVGVGGNLGEAALGLVAADVDVYVLELSSFQLERSQQHAYHKSCVLNISADHLDVHGDMRSYQQSKQQIYCAAQAIVFNRADAATVPMATQITESRASFALDHPPTEDDWGICEIDKVRWFCRGAKKLCPVDTFTLVGAHNEQNALAACALVDDTLNFTQMRAGLATFSGLAHRFEEVECVNGVRYINDSKATNVGATYAALEGLPKNRNLILIAGGDAKGVDLSPLGQVFKQRLKSLVAIGQDGDKLQAIAEELDIPNHFCANIESAVSIAAGLAVANDLVVLSPACASLDMFKNFMERGLRFSAAVKKLPGSRP